MPFVPVPKDLTKVKTKVALGLTKRQLVCFGAAAAIGIPTYLLTRGAIGNSAAVIVMIVFMLPAFFMAMYEKDGQPAEKLLRNFIRSRWFYPPKRPYKTENLYQFIEKEGLFDSKDKKTSSAGKAAVGKRQTGAAKQKRP